MTNTVKCTTTFLFVLFHHTTELSKILEFIVFLDCKPFVFIFSNDDVVVFSSYFFTMFVVLEGCDGTGKTTQTEKLVEVFKSKGYNVKMMRFPDRETPIGQTISSYLRGSTRLSTNMQHLLFVCNRWEKIDDLERGVSPDDKVLLFCDRYCYSGAAYSSAKGLPMDWCLGVEMGLPPADLILQLDMDPGGCLDRASKRGDEKELHDSIAFQETIRKNYATLKEFVDEQMTNSPWHVVDASKRPADVTNTLVGIVEKQLLLRKEGAAQPPETDKQKIPQ